MSNTRGYRSLAIATVLLSGIIGVSAARADQIPIDRDLTLINLEWRPASQTVFVGSTVEVGLYAAVEEGQQLFRALDMALAWDPTYLEFQGVGDVPELLLYSGFPSGDPYNLNELVPPQDGDGYYRAWANLGEPLEVTPTGVLLTTFQFTALALTPGTPVDIMDLAGAPALETTVWGGPGANTNVTGTLGEAWVEIVIPEPATLILLALVGCAARRR